MTITLTINNPYYEKGLKDMSEAAEMDVSALCTKMISKQIDGYVQTVKAYKREAVRFRLPDAELTKNVEVAG